MDVLEANRQEELLQRCQKKWTKETCFNSVIEVCCPCLSMLACMPKATRPPLTVAVKQRFLNLAGHTSQAPLIKVADGITEKGTQRFVYKMPVLQSRSCPNRRDTIKFDTILRNGKKEGTSQLLEEHDAMCGFTKKQDIDEYFAEPYLNEDSPYVFRRHGEQSVAVVRAWKVSLDAAFMGKFNVTPSDKALRDGLLNADELGALDEFEKMVRGVLRKNGYPDVEVARGNILFCKMRREEENEHMVLTGKARHLVDFLNQNTDIAKHYFRIQHTLDNHTDVGIRVMKSKYGTKDFWFSGREDDYILYIRHGRREMACIQREEEARGEKHARQNQHIDPNKITVTPSEWIKESPTFRVEFEMGQGQYEPGTRALEINLLKLISQGAYGDVYRANARRFNQESNGKLYAVKLTRLNMGGTRALRDVAPQERQRTNEIRVIDANQNFIVKAYLAFEVKVIYNPDNPGYIYDMGILMEYADGGSLEGKACHEATTSGVPLCPTWLETVRPFLIAPASALAYLHARQIVHRDVKPDNILLRQGRDGRKYACLTDFGTSKQFTFFSPIGTMRMGTPGYNAPEITAERDGWARYNEKCDVYSLGITFNAVLRRQRDETNTVLLPTANTDLNVPDQIKTLILKMTENVAACRTDAASVVQDDLFQAFTWRSHRFERLDLQEMMRNSNPA